MVEYKNNNSKSQQNAENKDADGMQLGDTGFRIISLLKDTIHQQTDNKPTADGRRYSVTSCPTDSFVNVIVVRLGANVTAQQSCLPAHTVARQPEFIPVQADRETAHWQAGRPAE